MSSSLGPAGTVGGVHGVFVFTAVCAHLDGYHTWLYVPLFLKHFVKHSEQKFWSPNIKTKTSIIF